jgi:minimal PKS ketosynthase (KS/KS alpha)
MLLSRRPSGGANMSIIDHGSRRTAITGIGVVAPGEGRGATIAQQGREQFWSRLIAGRSATRRITFFDPSGFRSQISAECVFDPYAAGLDDREVRRMDRYVQMASAAAMEAMDDSALEREALNRNLMAVSMGTALGGIMRLEEEYVVASNRGKEWSVHPDYISPFLYQALTPSTLASELALRFGAHGPSVVIGTGCTAGLDAIGCGHSLIRAGEADVVIAGGAESPISPLVLGSFDPIKATSHRNDDPEHASRPFDLERDGFVLGEGAAVLILEELEQAQTRDAHIYGEITGYATRSNAYHMTGLKADGLDLAATIGEALRQGNHRPEDIDHIGAHGTGTRQNDRHETAAYKQALGDHAYSIPICSIKSTIGYALGAAGALQLAACALAMEHSRVPPTMHLTIADPECDLDYTPSQARQHHIDVALATASGFGGLQSAVTLARIAA